MPVVEKSGGQLSVTLLCGHQVREPGPSFGRHPDAGDLHKCPKCKRIVPVSPIRA